MKIHSPSRTEIKAYALIIVMIICALGVFALAATLTRTANVAKLNERNRQLTVNVSVAEAATEKIMAQMIKTFRQDGAAGITLNLPAYRTNVPSVAENPFWGKFTFNDAQTDGRTFVQCISNWTYVPLEAQYYGLWGYAAKYRILSNARNNSGLERVTGAVQQDVQLAQIPIFQYAIYYNGLLEFTWAAPFVIRGRVHANGDVITGSTADLTFYSLVTATGGIFKKTWGGYNLGQMGGDINYKAGYTTNVPTLSLPIGTSNTAAAVREIINLPPAGESMYSPLGTNRFYNKAEITLLISNSSVTAQFRSRGGFDPAPTTLTWSNNNLPYFLTLTNSFTDLREAKTIRATQIDVAKYNWWAGSNVTVNAKVGTDSSTGSNNVPNLLYVADFRTTNNTSMLPAVRLVKGETLPPRGLTVVTPNPLYTLGNYNAPSAHLGTTNTTQTKPASLVSDALTILSPLWKDADSTAKLDKRDPADTTVNAAIITGIVYSDPADGLPFSGGVMNLPRLLEDWNGANKKLTLNTSIVNLYNSRYATNKWVSTSDPNAYYSAPDRNFNFDLNFTDKDKLPPGTPGLSALVRSRWTNPPPGVTNYAGN